MSGGVAWVLDLDLGRLNTEMVDAMPVTHDEITTRSAI